jgi:FAD/FMN-containing dehydrogenase
MVRENIRSWGLPGPFQHQTIDLALQNPDWRDATTTVLPFGNGRSYGDSCINDGRCLLLARGLDRYRAFDPQTGVLVCDAGVMLSDIVRDFMPRGWFPPVTPGTRFVTLGGAIANDIHGKNHHVAGTIGSHIESLVLERSDGSAITCSSRENAHLFRATIGGLGLTGLITAATLRLRPVETGWMRVHQQRFESLDEFFSINEWAESRYEYAVSWIDCATGAGKVRRGVYLAADHATLDEIGPRDKIPPAGRTTAVPLTPPFSLVHPLSVRGMNELYWRRASAKREFLQPVLPYFYPLDGILQWNRIYGPIGFYQYQCVLVHDAPAALAEMLAVIVRSRQASFLAVLKQFGATPSAGLLSFPRSGITLALDFPNRGQATHELFKALDEIVLGAGGALYPAKDARMSTTMFEAGYPCAAEFLQWKDPRFSSNFWRRVTGTE